MAPPPPPPPPAAPETPPASAAAVDGRRGGGRGRGRGNSAGRGGRHPSGRSAMAGRALVPTNHSASTPPPPPHHHHQHQHHHNPAHQQAQRPVAVHSSSGVPFGHVPAYLPGSASLVEELDQRILIVLRDGKHLIGVSEKTNNVLVFDS